MGNLRERAAYLLRNEGFAGLVAGGGRHARIVARRVARAEKFYVYEFSTARNAQESFKPHIAGLNVVVLESDEDVAGLIRRGFEAPTPHPLFRVSWLLRGAVAFCAYVNGHIAHIQWLAVSASARPCCDGLPYAVDFEHGVACWGRAYTWPAFRGLGIFTYMCGVRLRYLRERGYPACRSAVRVSNQPSLKAQAHWNPTICAVGWSFRLFGWRKWREHRLQP